MLTDGLVYDETALGDLINKDTDGDGVLDWEESLWGTDPVKRDTDGDNIPDDVEIARLKAESGVVENSTFTQEEIENLTETEKFARELLATVATLSQNGEINEETIDVISTSLAENIQNRPQRKIYTLADIKIVFSKTKEAVGKYGQELQTIQKKYPLNNNVALIVMEALTDDGDINIEVLNKFDPIIAQMNGLVGEMALTNTPEYLAPMHLLVMNGFQKLIENLEDMKLIESDAMVAFSAISKYEENSAELYQYIGQLLALISRKLNN